MYFHTLLVSFGKVENGDSNNFPVLINSLKNVISHITHVAFGARESDLQDPPPPCRTILLIFPISVLLI